MVNATNNLPPFEDEVTNRAASRELACNARRQDALRRFTATPYAANLPVMGSTIRIESNSRKIVEKAQGFFLRHRSQAPKSPDFVWRIIGESSSSPDETRVELSAFSDHGLRYAHLGQRNFVVVDVAAREAIAFLPETLVESEPFLHCRSAFDTLFCMCAATLGKVALEAACVGSGNTGILILGPPESGKTVTSYLAAKMGLELHADQVAFVENHGREIRVWGDLQPAVFRPGALEFLPELRVSTRKFSYPSLTVHYLSKQPFQSAEARPIRPAASVFLKRTDIGSFASRFVERSDRRRRLRGSLLYREDADFEEQTRRVLDALAALPSYEIVFGDPTSAAVRVRELLIDARHD